MTRTVVLRPRIHTHSLLNVLLLLNIETNRRVKKKDSVDELAWGSDRMTLRQLRLFRLCQLAG